MLSKVGVKCLISIERLIGHDWMYVDSTESTEL